MNTKDRDDRRRRPDPAQDDESGRRRRTDSLGRRREDRRGRIASRLVFFVTAFLFALGAFLWLRLANAPSLASGDRSPANPIQMLLPACADPFPAAGPTLANLDWNARASAVSTTNFINGTIIDRIVDLMSGDQVLLSVALPANQTSAVQIPAGAYGWRLRHGAAWCSSAGRFVREQRTIITNALQIVSTSTLTIHIEPDTQHPSGFALRTSDRPVVSIAATTTAQSGQPLPGGGILLPRAADGHYYLDGMVEGQPVRFMVDTGATGVAIPAELARQLGHYQGPEVISSTANGQAIGYAVRAARLTFGPFSAHDVDVAALPALDKPLLGMSLLQSLEIRQTAAGLELRPGR